jgi:hypothetical protein
MGNCVILLVNRSIQKESIFIGSTFLIKEIDLLISPIKAVLLLSGILPEVRALCKAVEVSLPEWPPRLDDPFRFEGLPIILVLRCLPGAWSPEHSIENY